MNRYDVERATQNRDPAVISNGGSIPYNYSHVAIIFQTCILNTAE